MRTSLRTETFFAGIFNFIVNTELRTTANRTTVFKFSMLTIFLLLEFNSTLLFSILLKIINIFFSKMDKNEVAELFFIVEELENTKSELTETHLKINKMKSLLKKETKEDKIYRLKKRIDTYKEKYEILLDISYGFFEELDEHYGFLAEYIYDEFTEEFRRKTTDHFNISEFVEKIDLIIEQLRRKRSEESEENEVKRQINERLQILFIVVHFLMRKADSYALRNMIVNIKDCFKHIDG